MARDATSWDSLGAGNGGRQVTDWSESTSTHFLDVAPFYVPQRERQIALVTGLVPRLPGATEAIDLCCGEGRLAEAILTAQPEASVLALDGSAAMRAAAERRMASFGARFRTAPCELEALEIPAGPGRRAVVSSLALHHVQHAAKPALYRRLFDALAPGGALVVADLVRPAEGAAWEDAAESWDAAVRAADAAAGMGGSVWERFVADRWNWFRFPDEVDRPAPLAAELEWLRAAGFGEVDAAWVDCGHAVFFGRRSL
jgi:tRNA (cmo5U34)-methyltransferase